MFPSLIILLPPDWDLISRVAFETYRGAIILGPINNFPHLKSGQDGLFMYGYFHHLYHTLLQMVVEEIKQIIDGSLSESVLFESSK